MDDEWGSLGERRNPQISPCFPSGCSEADTEKSSGYGRRAALTLRNAGAVTLRDPVGGSWKGRLEALRQCSVGSNKLSP